MKALWFLPFTFTAGAEGFALFAPYLIVLLSVLHLLRVYREARAAIAVPTAVPAALSLPTRPAPAL